MTLRHAIESANSNPGSDTINFDPSVFPAGSPAVINLADPLPALVGSGGGVLMDGTNAGVIVDGSSLDEGEGGLVVTSGGSAVGNVTFRQITLRNFPGSGIDICGGSLPGCDENVGTVMLDGVKSTDNGQFGLQILGDAIGSVDARNCELTGNFYGAYFKSDGDTNDVTFMNCRADSNRNSGVYLESLGSIIDASIVDTSVSNNGQLGSYFDSVDETIRPVIDNVDAIDNETLGIGFSSAQPLSDLTFVDSTVEGNGGAGNGVGSEVLAYQIDGATVTGNSFSNNDASNRVGGVGFQIYSQFQKPTAMTISNNIVNGNVGRGISIITDTPGTPDRGPSTISDNVISGNAWDGIYVLNSTRITISHNRIFDNDGIGINLAGGEGDDESSENSVTPNDPGDADEGSNDLLNWPVFTGANGSAVQGTACSNCTVELFVADGDPTNYGEGQTFIGEDTISGGSFSIPVCGVSQGGKVTATATDSSGNTSEFSLNFSLPFDTGACPGQKTWGNSDCSADGIRSRDAQAVGKFVLQGTPLTQTEPCPDVGSTVTVDGVERTWGNWDCSADGIRSRDAQASGKFVLQGTPLTQTEPCPDVGAAVQVS
jgi:parallel beta-helix repeat protein